MKNTLEIPTRRYSIFTDIIRGEYMIVVKGADIDHAEKWGGFVSWIGEIKPSKTITIRK